MTVVFGGPDPHSVIVQIFTYFPCTAHITALLRTGLGKRGILESKIDFALLLICAAAMRRLADTIFKYGSTWYPKKGPLNQPWPEKPDSHEPNWVPTGRTGSRSGV